MKLARNRLWLGLGCGVAIVVGAVTYLLWSPGSMRVSYDRARRGLLEDKSEAVTQMFGGKPRTEAIAHPDKVEAYRIGTPPSRGKNASRLDDYPILRGPVRVPNNVAAELSTVLLLPDSYGWDFAKGCLPEYGACISFHRGGDRVDVFLCFECDILLVAHNGVVAGGEDFDYIRPTLVRAVKALFPTDRVIQGLTDKGG